MISVFWENIEYNIKRMTVEKKYDLVQSVICQLKSNGHNVKGLYQIYATYKLQNDYERVNNYYRSFDKPLEEV